MTAAAFETPKTEIQRDRWGRPLVTPPGGGKAVGYTRATTYVGCLEDTFNLSKWQQRMVAAGLASRPDLLLRVNSLGKQPGNDDKDAKKRWSAQMDETCKAASEAAASSASATIGTALHSLTERIDRGLDVGVVPPSYLPHLKAYEDATRSFQAIHIERFTVLDDLQIGGTPDRVITIDGLPGSYIADLKTGSVDFGVGKMAMQLAVYAHSQLYNHETGQRAGLGDINQERGLIIALDATTGECRLIWVNLTAGWEAVQLATQVRAWRNRKDLSRPYDGPTDAPLLVTAPTPEVVKESQQQDLAVDAQAALIVAIQHATTDDELVELWTAAGPHWTPQHTELVKQRKAQLATPQPVA